MDNVFPFTFNKIEEYYAAAIELGYEVMTCFDYTQRKKNLPPLTIVNRVDIDFSMSKAERLCKIFNQIGIKATFFVRLHAPEYNLFSFENYRILKYIQKSGHEIGYHSEIIDQSAIWKESADDCLLRDIDILNRLIETNIQGIASHGGLTGLNNFDFWKNKKAKNFGVLYEAYEETGAFNLYKNSFYISDSQWTAWKCYDRGKLQVNDKRTPLEHFKNLHSKIYMLIHPDTYYDRHIYE